ncbi:translation initiation factor IF-3 [Arcanobacterium hippocoleae]|uniref:Translation initiation factor IF-3 n=1 Tax=Arcanobacterium hippocoleae TaxID=149017 RepID=A0ABU1T0P8_9ACTO|nr:translation initiation factor IF-3 [Arcanobacterium hippocoleae]MDR6938908.1 translation initiation factor IF-3 [Arcanobacterium hippocoleae]
MRVALKTRGAVINEPRINDRINVPEVRLVGPGGEQVGVIAIKKALQLAIEANLDLVEVAPNAKPPVAKLMDYGKYKYEAAQKAREARRNQANTQLKELRIGLKIDQHDYETKLKRIYKFLDGGDKVKIQLRFRGREQSRPEEGVNLMQRIAQDASENGVVESAPRVDGRSMVMVLAPIRRKSEAKSDQRRRREAERENRRAKEASRAQKNALKIAAKVTEVAEADTAIAE